MTFPPLLPEDVPLPERFRDADPESIRILREGLAVLLNAVANGNDPCAMYAEFMRCEFGPSIMREAEELWGCSAADATFLAITRRRPPV